MSPKAFVAGATGLQGSAVTRQLLELGWAVRAVSRNLDSPTAKKLQYQGAEFTAGDWEDEAVLKEAFNGCTHLFLNVVPPPGTPEPPIAERILAVAKSAGIKHVIYSSGLAMKDLHKDKLLDHSSPIGISHRRKVQVENMVKEAGFEAWTILRPSFFMFDFLAPKIDSMCAGLTSTNKWFTAYERGEKLPLIDMEDLGKFAAAAFREPNRFNGKTIEIASEKLSVEEIMQQLGEAGGRPLEIVYLTDEEIERKKNQDMYIAMQYISRGLANKVDIEEVKAWGIPLGAFKEFLEKERDLVKATFS
ncbi:hypothetical protein IL306_001558 [Fusarium sp. DS 682]|nr:hypothetical protein IL306_001558 [Fusarium sp. DS 682]